MRTIYKYGLKTTDVQTLKMPKGARILCVQTQRDEPQLWAEVDTDAPDESRVIETFGTGHHMRAGMGVERSYVGTYQLRGGSFVYHVYESTGV